MRCRACHSEDIFLFLNLGPMPLVNKLLSKIDEPETYYPLNVVKCNRCHLVQLDYSVDPEAMFKDYTYTPSSSRTMLAHFKVLVDMTLKECLSSKPFVIEIASNDGSLLSNYLEKKIRCLGVEPAANIAEAANKKGIPTLNDFFTSDTASKIVKDKGKADIIIGTNVLAHVPDIRDFTKGIKELLSESGFAVFESPYLMDFMENLEFDTVYHEHMFYLSVSPLKRLFEEFGLEIFKVTRSKVHGGSIQIFVQNKGACYKVDKSVGASLFEEENKGLYGREAYLDFSHRVKDLKVEINKELNLLKKKGKRIAGYGAAAKGDVLINYCGIGPDIIEYIVDKNILKQNKFIPGKRIPVFDVAHLRKEAPDYLIILPWNLSEEIREQEKWLMEKGCKFMILIPRVKYL